MRKLASRWLWIVVMVSFVFLSVPMARAGCGDYVFDRIHPGVIEVCGARYYRVSLDAANHAVEQQNDFANHFLAGRYRPAIISSAGQSERNLFVGRTNELVIVSESAGRVFGYSTVPPPCQSPACRRSPVTPYSAMPAPISGSMFSQPALATVNGDSSFEPDPSSESFFLNDEFSAWNLARKVVKPPC